MALVRLQKVLAGAGIASRRRSEQIIAEGRVTVDGRVVTEMGVQVDPAAQDVRCDGNRLRPEPMVYCLLCKPKGVVCTNHDPQGRRRAIDLIPGLPARVYTVGRLDADTQGLIVVTNDGDLAQRVSHPRFGVPKTYRAWVRGAMAPDLTKALMHGVALDGRRRRATAARIVERQPDRTLVELTLMEGCKHEVRRMLKALNHPVENLERIAIGPISGEDLWPGQWRRLTQGEVEALRAGRRSGPARPAARRPSRRDNREGSRTTRPSR